MNEKKGKRMGWLYNVCILFSLIAAFSLDMTPLSVMGIQTMQPVSFGDTDNAACQFRER